MMKKLFAAVVLLGSMAIMGGCSDDNYYYLGTESDDYVYEKVGRNHWKQYVPLDRYQIFFDERDITARMYENGMSNAYVWLYEAGVEVRKQLPFSYIVDYRGGAYLLTIDYDIQVGQVGFFVHCFPDMVPQSMLPDLVDFKLTLMWDNNR